MKTIFIRVLFLALLLLNSCGFFRSIGLYNVPPDYADTFEEINGIKFIDHPNLTSNIILELTSTQKMFSPYDSIKLRLRATNLSTIDTMYVGTLSLSSSYPFTELIVTDSINMKMKLLTYTEHLDYSATVDDYGRIVNPTIAPYSYFKFDPKHSRTKELNFQTGSGLFPTIYAVAFSLKKENIPGHYKSYYVQNHEEYDNIKGKINTKLISNTVEFY